MVTLISKWSLKQGCPNELLDHLKQATSDVEQNEHGTLLYSVHLPTPSPLVEPVPSIPNAAQDEIVFIEVYRDISAFQAHLNGSSFTTFREQNIHYFKEDPERSGWPLTDTQFLEGISCFDHLTTNNNHE